MPTLPAGPTLGDRLNRQINNDLIRAERSMSYFGAVPVAFDETPPDQITAFNDAAEWTRTTGGIVKLSGGKYGIDGPMTRSSYMNFQGAGNHQTWVQQLTPGAPIITSSETAGEGIYGTILRNINFYGGWARNWTTDLSTMPNAIVELLGPLQGPDDPVAFAREGVANLSDSYHEVMGCRFYNGQGAGLRSSGRGAVRIIGNIFQGFSTNALQIYSPDNVIIGNDISACGDDGVLITAGNNHFYGNKSWFVGMHSAVELDGNSGRGYGASYHIAGAGVQNVEIYGKAQDSWGPGYVDAGNGNIAILNIDEAGGGRLEEQVRGFQGARTSPRTFIALPTAKGAYIRGTLSGGDRNGAGNRPNAVYFSGSGTDDCDISLKTYQAVLGGDVTRAGGYNNANRDNVVTLDGKTVEGIRTAAELADATHSINAVSKRDQVLMDDGGVAVRQANGAWGVFAPGTTVTPA